MTEKVFKTVGERDKAVDEISIDPPDDIRRDQYKYQEWEKNVQQEIADLRNAKIDPETTEEPEEKVEDPEKKPDLSKPAESDETANLRRELDTYHKERIQLQDEAGQMKTDYETKLDELGKKQKDLEDQIKNPPQPEKPAEDHETNALESDLETVNRDMANLTRDDDPEKYDKAVNRKIDIGNKLTLLRVKRDKEFQTQHKAELQKMKDDAKKQQEQSEAEKKASTVKVEEERKRKAFLKEVNSFKDSHDEFKSDLSYEDMFHEADRFHEKVAADYWSKSTYKVTAKDKEIAMMKYREKDSMMPESLKKKGIKEPKSYGQYDILSKVVHIKRGVKLTKEGDFEKYVDGEGVQVNLPDMEASYNHFNNISGKRDQELIQAMKDGAAGASAAINQRSDPRELDEGQQKQVLDTEETPEQALEMLGKKGSDGLLLFDDVKMGDMAQEAHRAGKPMPTIVKEYNKHMKVIGQRSVEETLGLT